MRRENIRMFGLIADAKAMEACVQDYIKVGRKLVKWYYKVLAMSLRKMKNALKT